MGTGGEGALGRGFGGIVQMSPAVPRWQDGGAHLCRAFGERGTHEGLSGGRRGCAVKGAGRPRQAGQRGSVPCGECPSWRRRVAPSTCEAQRRDVCGERVRGTQPSGEASKTVSAHGAWRARSSSRGVRGTHPPPPRVWREPRKAQRARVLRGILSTEHPGRAWRVGDDRDMLAGRKDGSWRRHGTGGPAGGAVTATRCEAQRSCPPSVRLPARVPGAPSGVGVCPWVVPWRPLPFYSL